MTELDNPLLLAAMVFPVSSLAGLAALLRSNEELTRRAVASSMINAGLFGVGIVLGGYHMYGITHIWLLLAAGIFAGLGGNALLDFALQIVKAWVKRYGNGVEGNMGTDKRGGHDK